MAKPKETAMRVFIVLLVLAAVTQGKLPAGYAQSTRAASQNTYFIQGAVTNPGVYRNDGATSLLQLLVLAGGLANNHGAAAFIIRRLPAPAAGEERGFKVISVRINELLRGSLNANANLEPGDIVNIPQSDVFLVAIEGKSSGTFPFIEGLTLLEGLSRARALNSGTKPGRAVIFRQDPITGQRQEIRVELDAVESGKQEDIPLMPNDIIVVTTGRAITVSRFQDFPPIRSPFTCAGSGPCLALAS